MSAACAADTAPNIAATNQNLRIATLHRTRTVADDHGSLTLINCCIEWISVRSAMKNMQSKTARKHPAPLRRLKKSGERSALGDQRRRRIDRRAVEIPAHADHQVIRGDVLEPERIAAAGPV